DWGSPDAIAMMRSMTKYTAVANTSREAVLGLQMAVKHAVSGCPGPTALLLKSEALAAEFTADPGPPIYRRDRDPRLNNPVPSPRHIEAALKVLSEAENPVIVAGNG